MNLLLVGSRSLSTQVDLGRECNDWDIYCNAKFWFDWFKRGFDYRIIKESENKLVLKFEDSVVEVSLFKPDHPKYKLIEYCASKGNLGVAETPIGTVWSAPLEVHYLLKKTSIKNMEKHKADLEKIGQIEIPEELSGMEEQLKKAKFFEKYEVTRYIDHDKLHTYVAKAFNREPLYPLILVDSVNISKDKFDALSYDLKCEMVIDEAIVLSLERFFLFNVGKKKDVFDLWAQFVSGKPTTRWLEKLCGNLKDHPEWLRDWCHKNYSELLNRMREKISTLRMPKEFWLEVRKIK